MIGAMPYAKEILKPLTNLLVFCQFPAIVLDKYNKWETEFTAQQEIIDDGIIHLNRVVSALNYDTDCFIPFLLEQVHCMTRGRRYNKYAKLYDGLHPDMELADVWAKNIVTAAIKNHHYYGYQMPDCI